MSTNPNIRLDGYFFMDQGNLYWRLGFRFQKYFLPINPFAAFTSPLLKRKAPFWRRNYVSLIETAKAAGLYDETLHPNFRLHQKGLNNYRADVLAIICLVLPPLVIALMIGQVFLLQQLPNSFPDLI